MKLTRTVLAAALAVAAIDVQAASQLPRMAAPAIRPAQADAQLLAALAARRPALGLDADHGHRISHHHPGAEGTMVVRIDHTYKGVRVFGSETLVVTNGAGKVVSETVSDRRSGLGKGKSNLLGGVTASFDVTPRLSAQEAIDRAGRGIEPKRFAAAPPQAELIVYPLVRTERVKEAQAKGEEELNALDLVDVVTGYELAYYVRSRYVVGSRPVYRDSIVSARDGSILAEWDALQTAEGVGHSQYNGKVPLHTTPDGKLFRMIDPTRGSGGAFGGLAITNADHGNATGEVYSHTENVWGDGKQFVEGGSTTGANGQTAAVNAMWGMSNTYDMLKRTLGWHSLDGKDTATHINVHVNRAYDNAYYDDSCRCMSIGDGQTFYNLGSIDVIGHEMSHGVTAATSRLLYFAESGGLNESSSDIIGEVVESYARNGGTGESIPADGNDWSLGKEIARDGMPLRWMHKPSLDNRSPDAWSSSLKGLDVHYSSGPNNRMFYFLSRGSDASPSSESYSKYLTGKPAAMSGIGMDKAYRIWFTALTTRFTMITNYADARKKMIEVGQQLYGRGSPEEVAVTRAYAAINVGKDIDEPKVRRR
ncbi:M4 family metallopeptidase [Pseudoduganella sp. GCM10020061]|uniref:M4 family metallopeptidase n=1 Tax=Pseudoduganella sp. GCM10020061 TaxID=3317345 RepID=UPI003627A055